MTAVEIRSLTRLGVAGDRSILAVGNAGGLGTVTTVTISAVGKWEVGPAQELSTRSIVGGLAVADGRAVVVGEDHTASEIH